MFVTSKQATNTCQKAGIIVGIIWAVRDFASLTPEQELLMLLIIKPHYLHILMPFLDFVLNFSQNTTGFIFQFQLE